MSIWSRADRIWRRSGRHGVRVLSPRGDFAARPPATDDPREIGPVDHVFLGLKANAYAAAARCSIRSLKDDTAVIAAQNGIPWWYFHRLEGPHEGYRIERSIPAARSVRDSRPTGHRLCRLRGHRDLAARESIQHLEGTRFSIGEPDARSPNAASAFSEAMVAGGLKCPVEPDLRNDIWIKLMGNISFNPISALSRATMSQICLHGDTRER